MHPLMMAYIRHKQLLDLNLRVESWYYETWQDMLVASADYIRELKAAPS